MLDKLSNDQFLDAYGKFFSDKITLLTSTNNEFSKVVLERFNQEYDLIENLFLSNKDYKETEGIEITLKIISKDKSVYWTDTGLDESYLKLIPKVYPLKIVNKNGTTSKKKKI